jgi:hypothetical protein
VTGVARRGLAMLPSSAEVVRQTTLDAMIAFYESSAGKRMRAAQSAILKVSVVEGQECGRKLGIEVARELQTGK